MTAATIEPPAAPDWDQVWALTREDREATARETYRRTELARRALDAMPWPKRNALYAYCPPTVNRGTFAIAVMIATYGTDALVTAKRIGLYLEAFQERWGRYPSLNPRHVCTWGTDA